VAALWKEAGLPDGVLSVVHGDKEAVDALPHPPEGQGGVVRRLHPDRQVRLRDRHRARQAACRPSVARRTTCSCSRRRPRPRGRRGGQRRASARPASAAWRSRPCLAVDTIADDLIEKIKDRVGKLVTGDGTRGCDMGPLVTAQHRDKVTSYLDAGTEAGATLVIDGREGDVDSDGEGYFLKPTLFDNVTKDMSIYQDEIFGPVLSVLRVKTYDEALELINSNPYGNGTAIFTNDGGAARRFQNEVEVGMIGVNVPIPVPMAYYSFGGWKNSLFGDSHAHGMEGVHFFTRGKVVTSRWLDPSHGGIELGFPQNV
jgi:malonate-semialdehyde dehydrogenase (acetylating)/methylmalonate-semialdehyde dehydrogenase